MKGGRSPLLGLCLGLQRRTASPVGMGRHPLLAQDTITCCLISHSECAASLPSPSGARCMGTSAHKPSSAAASSEAGVIGRALGKLGIIYNLTYNLLLKPGGLKWLDISAPLEKGAGWERGEKHCFFPASKPGVFEKPLAEVLT